MSRRKITRSSALGALLLLWAQGKQAEHPPRIGWPDAVILGGLALAWWVQKKRQ